MDWASIVVGALVGAVAGVVLSNIMFPSIQVRSSDWRRRRSYARANAEWANVEDIHPRLRLIQAGWDRDGCFPEGSVLFELGDPFLPGEVVRRLRKAHAHGWSEQGFTDGEQVGLQSISIARISDDPHDDLRGQAHRITVRAHEYRYFDFLASHVLRLQGSPEERRALEELAGPASPDRPASGFPTPCSVGLSVFCESGSVLLLTRRTANSGSGGYWEPGRIFNCVGENTALRDFAATNSAARHSSPHTVARRGLWEEVGLGDEQILAQAIQIHSLAWASDLLDYKFFGHIETTLSQAEVQDRWRNAPDRSETAGFELTAWPARSREDCRKILSSIHEQPDDWSPEAVFCTVRSLIALRRIAARDLLRAMSA